MLSNIGNLLLFLNIFFFLIVLKAIVAGKISIRKIINAIHCQFAYILRLKKSGKSPIVISVDLWNECNENCVFCRSEKGEIYDIKTQGKAPIIKGKLEIEYFKKIVDETFKTSIMIVPYINGEPLMYKGIYDAIKYASSKKMFTLIASNGILLNRNNSERLIESGLDFLKVHISGMTKEVHSIQHRKGDVELILNNLKRIVELKKDAPEKINKIATETSAQLIKQLIGEEINNSSISAIVEDLSKKNKGKYYGN